MDAPDQPGFYEQSHAEALKPIVEALFHSRLDHPGPREQDFGSGLQRVAAHQRLDEAERAVAALESILKKCGCK